MLFVTWLPRGFYLEMESAHNIHHRASPWSANVRTIPVRITIDSAAAFPPACGSVDARTVVRVARALLRAYMGEFE